MSEYMDTWYCSNSGERKKKNGKRKKELLQPFKKDSDYVFGRVGKFTKILFNAFFNDF